MHLLRELLKQKAIWYRTFAILGITLLFLGVAYLSSLSTQEQEVAKVRLNKERFSSVLGTITTPAIEDLAVYEPELKEIYSFEDTASFFRDVEDSVKAVNPALSENSDKISIIKDLLSELTLATGVSGSSHIPTIDTAFDAAISKFSDAASIIAISKNMLAKNQDEAPTEDDTYYAVEMGLAGVESKEASIFDNKALYKSIAPLVDLMKSMQPEGIKESIILNDEPASAGHPFYRGAGKWEFDYDFKTLDLELAVSEEGLKFNDKSGKEIMHSPAPYFIDASGQKSFDIRYEIIEESSEVIETTETIIEEVVETVEEVIPVEDIPEETPVEEPAEESLPEETAAEESGSGEVVEETPVETSTGEVVEEVVEEEEAPTEESPAEETPAEEVETGTGDTALRSYLLASLFAQSGEVLETSTGTVIEETPTEPVTGTGSTVDSPSGTGSTLIEEPTTGSGSTVDEITSTGATVESGTGEIIESGTGSVIETSTGTILSGSGGAVIGSGSTLTEEEITPAEEEESVDLFNDDLRSRPTPGVIDDFGDATPTSDELGEDAEAILLGDRATSREIVITKTHTVRTYKVRMIMEVSEHLPYPILVDPTLLFDFDEAIEAPEADQVEAATENPGEDNGLNITGRVFEDVNYSGGNGTAYDPSADHPLTNVDLEIYTAEEEYLATTSTDENGTYEFDGLPGNRNYIVRVVSETINDMDTVPAGGYTGDRAALPEQVYESDGFNSNGGPGALGGNDREIDDTDTPAEEGIGDTNVLVTLGGSNLSQVYFGFSYDVVASTRNEGQGSMRQFVANSNAIDRANNAIFEVGLDGRIPLIRDLPVFDNESGGTTMIGNGNITLDGSLIEEGTLASFINSPGNMFCGFVLIDPGPGDTIVIAGALSVANQICNNVITNLVAGGVAVRNGANNNVIGTDGDGINDALEGNNIFGCPLYGVVLEDPGTNNNIVAGNRIGTDNTGTIAQGNGTHGVFIRNQASGNLIGTNGDGISDNLEQNTISANGQNGVFITDPGTNNNVVAGNYIGTDINGTFALANGLAGVDIQNQAQGNLIGTNGDGVQDVQEMNLLSGNLQAGLAMSGVGTQNNTVAGNYIGTDTAGNVAIANGNYGIQIIANASNNIIGTNGDGSPGDATEMNLISGNINGGILVNDPGTNGNAIAGNYIGTNTAGLAAIANNGPGVSIGNGGQFNRIGTNADGVSDTIEMNLISGNTNHGAQFNGPNTDNNTFAGNYVGLDTTGTNGLPNAGNGVTINNANNNIIGTNGDGINDGVELNNISANQAIGVSINGNSSGNRLAGNDIGIDTGGTPRPNLSHAVLLDSGSNNNFIGTNGDGSAGDGNEGNLISGNGGDGVRISDLTTNNNTVAGNFIGTNGAGNAAQANGQQGVHIMLGAQNNIIGTNNDGTFDAGERNLISGNTLNGVRLFGANTNGNMVYGNEIGTDVSATFGVPNGAAGIEIDAGPQGNFIGNTNVAATSNTIAFNPGDGVTITGAASINNSIRRNAIFSNGGHSIDLNNDGITLNDLADADAGPNNLMNAPVPIGYVGNIASAIVQPGAIVDVYVDNGAPANAEMVTYVGSLTENSGGDLSATSTSDTIPKTFSDVSARGWQGNFPGLGGLLPGNELVLVSTDPAGNTSEASRFRLGVCGTVYDQGSPAGPNTYAGAAGRGPNPPEDNLVQGASVDISIGPVVIGSTVTGINGNYCFFDDILGFNYPLGPPLSISVHVPPAAIGAPLTNTILTQIAEDGGKTADLNPRVNGASFVLNNGVGAVGGNNVLVPDTAPGNLGDHEVTIPATFLSGNYREDVNFGFSPNVATSPQFTLANDGELPAVLANVNGPAPNKNVTFKVLAPQVPNFVPNNTLQITANNVKVLGSTQPGFVANTNAMGLAKNWTLPVTIDGNAIAGPTFQVNNANNVDFESLNIINNPNEGIQYVNSGAGQVYHNNLVDNGEQVEITDVSSAIVIGYDAFAAANPATREGNTFEGGGNTQNQINIVGFTAPAPPLLAAGHIIAYNDIGRNAALGAAGSLGDAIQIKNGPFGGFLSNIRIGADVTAFNADEVNFIGNAGAAGIDLGLAGNPLMFGNEFKANDFVNNVIAIDLLGDGPTPNDLGDVDAGPNNVLNFPTIASAIDGGVNVTVTTNADAVPFQEVGFYNATVANGTFLGTATANAGGVAVFVTPLLNVGDQVAVTANDGGNSTSEFSPPVPVTGGNGIQNALVFEDVNYSGGPGTAFQGGTDNPLENVIVEAYNFPAGTFVSATTTDPSGLFSFNLAPGQYYIRSVTASISDLDTTPDAGRIGTQVALPEQTFETDGITPNGGPGAFGGDNRLVSDTVTALTAGPGDTNVVVTVPAGPALTGVEIGYNFDVVTHNLDDGEGSFRRFIEAANTRPTPNTAILEDCCSPVALLSPLPTLTDSGTTIDGLTESGAVLNTNGTGSGALTYVLDVEYDGSALAAGEDILTIESSFNTIKGINFRNAPDNAIVISGTGATNNLIGGNYIGTNVSGTGAAANGGAGVLITGGGSGNVIGSNNDGIDDVAEKNVISGNTGGGIIITGTGSDFNVVAGNYIGLGADGATAIANSSHGVHIEVDASFNRVGSTSEDIDEYNIIANNLGAGVFVDGITSPIRNTIRFNSFFSNTGLGIDISPLGVNANDAGDGDTGANTKLNVPDITSVAVQAGTGTVISGSIDIDTTASGATVEIYLADDDPSGSGEGMTYLGETTPNGLGAWTFTYGVEALGSLFTATTTDIAGNTSEFAINRKDELLLKIVSGNNQTGDMLTPLPDTLRVQVTNSGGTVFGSGVTVDFVLASQPTGTSSGAVLSSTGVVTDASGFAEITLTLGDKAGIYTVTADFTGNSGSAVTFTETERRKLELDVEVVGAAGAQEIMRFTDADKEESVSIKLTFNGDSLDLVSILQEGFPQAFPAGVVYTIPNFDGTNGHGQRTGTGSFAAFTGTAGDDFKTIHFSVVGPTIGSESSGQFTVDFNVDPVVTQEPGNYNRTFDRVDIRDVEWADD